MRIFPIGADDALVTFNHGASASDVYRISQRSMDKFASLDEEIWQFEPSPDLRRLAYSFVGLVDKDKPRQSAAQDQKRVAANLKIRELASDQLQSVPVDAIATTLAKTPSCWN